MFRFDKHYCMVFELLHPRPLTDFFNGLDETKVFIEENKYVAIYDKYFCS